MDEIFGHRLDRKAIDRLIPDLFKIAGVRHYREDNGPGTGQRIIRIESGGGLSVELFPDRTCDIGQVWCGKTPFGWVGPIGAGTPSALGANQPLSGLMSTCGFDHIRQPEAPFPMHGSMRHQPATISLAGPVEVEGQWRFRVMAEATQFSLDRGGMRLHRTIDVPLGGRTILVEDRVTVLAKPQPIMAMYHINLGFPLAGPNSVLMLDRNHIGRDTLQRDGIVVNPSPPGPTTAELRSDSRKEAELFRLEYDGRQLAFFQTLRNGGEGINLICLEPATHPRLSRAELEGQGLLASFPVGHTQRFSIAMTFGGLC